MAAFGRIVLAGFALSLAGCASNADRPDGSAYVRGPQVAEQQPPPGRVELEDDGLPVQSPPVTPPRALPDDPREPFSPNYGGPSKPPAKSPSIVPQRSVEIQARAAFSRQAPPHNGWRMTIVASD
jgi:hypothetical protein